MKGKNSSRIIDLLEPRPEPPFGNRRRAAGIKNLVGEPLNLSSPLRKLFFTLIKEGAKNQEELVSVTGLEPQVARECLKQLKRRGYINKRGDFFLVNADFREHELFPEGPRIPLIYQYNLLSDEKRVLFFKEAIDQQVRYGDVVADLGAGVGILSILVAERAKKIYAVEVDPRVFEAGRDFVEKLGYSDKIEYILDDAREVILPEKVDVIICEMIDTALIAELQVPVLNRATKAILKKSGRVIPFRAYSTAQLVYSDYEFFGREFKLFHFEGYGGRESITEFSEEKPYHEVIFTERNELMVKERIVLASHSSGTVNGFRIKTYVETAPGLIAGQSSWLNPPLTLPFSQPYNIHEGDEIEIYLEYELGGSLQTIHWGEKCKIREVKGVRHGRKSS